MPHRHISTMNIDNVTSPLLRTTTTTTTTRATTTGTGTVTSQSSVVTFNNCALFHFLNGNYKEAIEQLNCAQKHLFGEGYDSNLKHLSTQDWQKRSPFTEEAQNKANITETSASSSSSSSFVGMKAQQYGGNEQDVDTKEDVMDLECDLPGSNALSPAECCEPMTGSRSTAMPAASHTMYNRGLVLTESGDVSFLIDSSPLSIWPTTCLPTLLRTSAIVQYNLALVYHNMGILSGASVYLHKALRLYGQSLRTLEEIAPSMTILQQEQEQYLGEFSTMDNTNTIGRNVSRTCISLCYTWRLLDIERLLLAILNNMGNLHVHYLCDARDAKVCMEFLRMMLDISSMTTSLLQLPTQYSHHVPMNMTNNMDLSGNQNNPYISRPEIHSHFCEQHGRLLARTFVSRNGLGMSENIESDNSSAIPYLSVPESSATATPTATTSSTSTAPMTTMLMSMTMMPMPGGMPPAVSATSSMSSTILNATRNDTEDDYIFFLLNSISQENGLCVAPAA